MTTVIGVNPVLPMLLKKSGLQRKNTNSLRESRMESKITIENICRLCRLHSGNSPCDTPCEEWHKLLDELLQPKREE